MVVGIVDVAIAVVVAVGIYDSGCVGGVVVVVVVVEGVCVGGVVGVDGVVGVIRGCAVDIGVGDCC